MLKLPRINVSTAGEPERRRRLLANLELMQEDALWRLRQRIAK
jgi:hypothetical protein